MLGRILLNLPAILLSGQAQVTQLGCYSLVWYHFGATRIARRGDLSQEITAQVALNERDNVEQD